MNQGIKYVGIFLIAVTTLALLPEQRDYQLDVGEENIQVWDGNRHVGTITFQDTSNITELDNLILLDNH
jgi:hypothetical protein